MKKFFPFLLLIAGCRWEEYRETDTSPFVAQKSDYYLVFAIDMSSPFRNRILNDTGAYKFMMGTVARFFHQRAGADSIILAQLSSRSSAVVWQGKPASLKRECGTSEGLRAILTTNSDPAGSPRIYAGLAETLEYVMHLPGVRDRQARVCVVVISSMVDTDQAGRERLVAALKDFGSTGGYIGNLWVDMEHVAELQSIYREAGLPAPYFTPIPNDEIEPLTFEE